ncbi:group III truncated hemoglobin [Rhodobacteraceae bacterium B1Z28]|uniref:Group III truncated hemoglobin n=1 Tax=Ruegeria haliotis TaxID=2747601 RepID=A0ABX2PPN1_9RHOB|nr:group III truncated hemoglobin [Ruegeria haliotis]NVO56082.1 group III truncated hemoglobin [Ruegeria haliotis]
MSRPVLPPRFPATPDQINAQVRVFYARVRQDSVLGPVFANHVDDWPAHEEKIAAFWRNAILFERSYDGNPQRVHIERQDVKPEFFAHWLDLFEEVATQTLPPETAIPWIALARRIGVGMKAGVQSARQSKDAPPILR